YRLSPLHHLHGFPGPVLHKVTELPMLYYVVRGTRHKKVKSLHDQYGRIVQTGPNTLSFLSASAIAPIYGSSNALDKSTAYDVQHMKGEGIFFIKDKATHSRRRRIWNRSFSEHALSQYNDPLVLEVEHLIRWLLKRTADNGKVDVVKILPQYSFDSIVSFQRYRLDSILTNLLDSDDPEQIAPEASKFFAISEVLTHIEPLFHVLVHIPGISRFMNFEKLSIIAAERRLKNGPSFQDGISHWFDGDEFQPNLDPSDLPIEAETILLGGADTVGGISIFVLYFLIANPKWMALLQEELDDIFDEQSSNRRLHSLDQLVILNAVIQESLRLGTPLPGLPRIVPDGGVVIDGHHVPSGTVVNVPVWAYHVDEEYFPNPNVFDPSRWIENGKFSAKATLLAFGAGPFNCVGPKLVFIQLRMLIAMVVLRLELTPEPGFNAVKFWNGIRNRRTTAFSERLWVHATPRDRSH
ncbi:cytochrome P450, partial [Mycena sp. CBHHK59/15]